MDSFQVRKNDQEVIRISRGSWEDMDLTRIQVWYRDRDTGEYMHGRHVVAFNSELIPGIIEGLQRAASDEPRVELSDPEADTDPAGELSRILKAHGRPLHFDFISKICKEELKGPTPSDWTVYNCLLAHRELFDQVDEDVFAWKR